jgi:hypothetical protein
MLRALLALQADFPLWVARWLVELFKYFFLCTIKLQAVYFGKKLQKKIADIADERESEKG